MVAKAFDIVRHLVNRGVRLRTAVVFAAGKYVPAMT